MRRAVSMSLFTFLFQSKIIENTKMWGLGFKNKKCNSKTRKSRTKLLSSQIIELVHCR